MSDKAALLAVKILRWGLDKATGYKHQKAVDVDIKDPVGARKQFAMTEQKYLIRNVFLESVAGVPGMVAGMLRHLHSMRRMKRDNGWYVCLLTQKGVSTDARFPGSSHCLKRATTSACTYSSFSRCSAQDASCASWCLEPKVFGVTHFSSPTSSAPALFIASSDISRRKQSSHTRVRLRILMQVDYQNGQRWLRPRLRSTTGRCLRVTARCEICFSTVRVPGCIRSIPR